MFALAPARQRGFTLVEMLLVMGLFVILAGLALGSLSTLIPRTTLSASTQTLLSDIRGQQLKAMAGETSGGGVPSSFGIRLESSGYILFSGNTYVGNEATSFSVALEETVQVTTTLPGQEVVFEAGTGESPDLPGLTETITITNTVNGTSEVIRLNRLGVVEAYD